MVCSGEGERGGSGGGMAVSNMEKGRNSDGGGGGGGGGSENRWLKSPLHNFNLPSMLKWGHQRHLRPIKLPDHTTSIETTRNQGFLSPPPKRLKTAADHYGIEAVREKIMSDLKTAADRMKDAIFCKEDALDFDCSSPSLEEEDVVVPEKEEKDEVKRWNLRTRRGSVVYNSTAPVGFAGVSSQAGGGGGGEGRRVIGGGYRNSLPTGEGENGKEEKKRKRLVVELTRKEIEDDFMEMVGRRPARRPKKRPRNVQRQLDTLFPGLWLMRITLDAYKVHGPPDYAK